MTRPGKSELLLHNMRRAIQTPRTFENWGPLLRDIGLQRSGRGHETLTFRARSGMIIDCPNVPGARVPLYEIFAEDCYRMEWFLGPRPAQPLQVIDIGAHIGTFACRLAQLYPTAIIRSFEPSPVTAGFLRKNVDQNGLGGRVAVFEAAVTATEGVALLADNGGGSGLNSLMAAAGKGSDGAEAPTEVRSVAFDSLVTATPSRIDLVKIDCEGGEYDLVQGSTPANWASVRRVVIEYHEVKGQTWAALRSFFESVGLHVVHESEGRTDVLGSAWLSRRPQPPTRG